MKKNLADPFVVAGVIASAAISGWQGWLITLGTAFCAYLSGRLDG